VAMACCGCWLRRPLLLAAPRKCQDLTFPRICAARRRKRSGKGHFPGSGRRREVAFAATEGGSRMWQFPGRGIVQDVEFSWIWHRDVAFPGMWQFKFPARGLPRDLDPGPTEERRKRDPSPPSPNPEDRGKILAAPRGHSVCGRRGPNARMRACRAPCCVEHLCRRCPWCNKPD